MARLLHLVFESRDRDGQDDLRRFLAFMRGSIDRALQELDRDPREQSNREPSASDPRER